MAEETKNKNATEQVEEITEEQATEETKKYANNVSAETVADMVDKEEKMMGFFKNCEKLKKYWDDALLVFSLLKDWKNGSYTKVPWAVIVSLTAALLYVLSPLDLIPDFLVGFGFMDDATVFGVALLYAKDALEEYKAWKKAQENTIDA